MPQVPFGSSCTTLGTCCVLRHHRCRCCFSSCPRISVIGLQVQYIQADEECLPLKDGSVDGANDEWSPVFRVLTVFSLEVASWCCTDRWVPGI